MFSIWPTQRRLLVDYLARQNFRVSGVAGSAALRKLMERDRPALVLLDVGLPDEDGFAIARWMRESSARIGIIMVTAASDTVDRVVGLETGADDYIAKPFDPRELLARVKSVLRRATGGAPPTAGPRIRMGCRVLDLEKARASRPGEWRRGNARRERVRSPQGFRGAPQQAASTRLAARSNCASRDGAIRSCHRLEDYPSAAR